MSWSLSTYGTRDECREYVAKSYAPSAVKAYCLGALDKFDDDALLAISGSGHLYEGGTSGNVTSASLNIHPLTDEEKKAAGYRHRWTK